MENEKLYVHRYIFKDGNPPSKKKGVKILVATMTLGNKILLYNAIFN